MFNEPTARYWLARLSLTLTVMALTFVTSFEPRTMVYAIVRLSGQDGVWCVLFLGVVAFVGLVDTVINDIMPPQYHLRCVKRHRHVIYMLTALGLCSMAYIVAKHAGPSPVHFTLAIYTSVSAAIAFFDLFARHGK